MVNFSCKKISREDLVRCAFSLNKTEYNVLVFLLGNKGKHSPSGIAGKMELDRTTVQKAMKNICGKNLAKRTQKNLAGGGYTFLYEINNKEEIKNEMKRITHSWYKSVEEAISRY